MKGLTRTLLLSLVAASGVVSAGDPQPPQAPAATPPPLTPPPAPSPSPSPTTKPPAPAGDIQDFVPSERVKADDAVTFPTDI